MNTREKDILVNDIIPYLTQDAFLNNVSKIESNLGESIDFILINYKDVIPWLKEPELQTEEMKLFLSLRNHTPNQDERVKIKIHSFNETSQEILKNLPEDI